MSIHLVALNRIVIAQEIDFGLLFQALSILVMLLAKPDIFSPEEVMYNKKYFSFVVLSVLLLGSFRLAADSSSFEIVHSFERAYPPGNIAVAKNGRVFITLHQFWNSPYRLAEISEDGSLQPYPNAKLSEQWGDILGVTIDKNNTLWLLEQADGLKRAGRVIAWDTNKNQLKKVIYLAAPIIPEVSFLNDIVIDPKNNAVYISDTATAEKSALIVIDLNTGSARRVLEGSTFTTPEDINVVIDGRIITLGDTPARVGVNSITVDNKYEWVYFGPTSGSTLFRVRTMDLLNPGLAEEALRTKVERYGDKPISDGITIDSAGNVYVTDITSNAVGVVDSTGKYRKIFEDADKLSWVDGFAVGPNSMIYATVNQLHRSPVMNGGEDGMVGDFHIIRFKSLAKAAVGR